MRSIYFTSALLASALALAGCNRSDKTAAGNATNAAAPAAPTEPAAPAGNETATEEGAAPTAEVQGQAQQNFTINNNTGHIVVTLNVSPNDEDEWGPDILGRDMLANGESAAVTFQRGTEQCIWDIRATYDDGDTTDVRGVNLCQVATVNLTP
jgi:predicted small secreted protein